MFARTLEWLVGKWQWPYAALFTAMFLGVLAPFVFRYAGLPLGLVFLQLPIYMLHQYEEHAGDRFRLWINTHDRAWSRSLDANRHLLDQLTSRVGARHRGVVLRLLCSTFP